MLWGGDGCIQGELVGGMPSPLFDLAIGRVDWKNDRLLVIFAVRCRGRCCCAVWHRNASLTGYLTLKQSLAVHNNSSSCCGYLLAGEGSDARYTSKYNTRKRGGVLLRVVLPLLRPRVCFSCKISKTSYQVPGTTSAVVPFCCPLLR